MRRLIYDFFGKDRRPLDSAQLATEYYGNIGNVEPDGAQSCQVNSLSNLWPASFIRQKANASIETLFSPKVFFFFSTVNWYSHRAARCRTPRTRATWDCRGRHGINLKKKQRKGQRHRKSWHRILKHIETDGPVDFV